MRISEQERNDKWKVFIGIDELDRSGSVEQARAFLAEIKAIFGIPGIYFILAVAEDVGAAFIQRGLPARDVTDSSLEDVIHIEPRGLPDSANLLQSRIAGFTDPFVALAHCLSGGLPRDLIRYTRRIIEIRHRIQQPELNHIADYLLAEELIQTLSSFRVLLGNHPHSAKWGLIQHRLHDTVIKLRKFTFNDVSTSSLSIERDIYWIAVDGASPVSSGTDSVTADDALSIYWEELSAYTLYVITLIEVFARPHYAARRMYVEMREDGSGRLQRLADARLELGISPGSARLIIGRFRTAWELADPSGDRD